MNALTPVSRPTEAPSAPSRRDHLAALIISGMIAKSGIYSTAPNMLDQARDAYRMADAMIEASAEQVAS